MEIIEQTEKAAIQDMTTKHVRKKTHKGEVEVEEEDLSILEVNWTVADWMKIYVHFFAINLNFHPFDFPSYDVDYQDLVALWFCVSISLLRSVPVVDRKTH